MKSKRLLPCIEIGLTIILLLINEIFFSRYEEGTLYYVHLVLYILTYVIIGGRIIFKAIRNIFKGRVFDEFFLMSLATIVALILKQYFEGVMVMLFYQIGELFQSIAVDRARKSIKSLVEIAPNKANRVIDDNELEVIDVDEINLNDILLVKVGEKIPVDGIIIDGYTSLDTSSLTGESIPTEVNVNDSVISGSINLGRVIKIKATSIYEESTIYKIISLIEDALDNKGKTEKFITKFARIYTPTVVILAILLATIPPLFDNYNFSTWIYRALSFLVISCPCALVISIPLSFFSGIGNLSKKGILVKGDIHLENLFAAKTFFFDKTGTLTKGSFKVKDVHIEKDEDLFYKLLVSLESKSTHPLAFSILEEYKDVEILDIDNIEEVPGCGLKGLYQDKLVLVGNASLLNNNGISVSNRDETSIYVSYDKEYLGYVSLEDEIKDDAYETMQKLKKIGVKKLIMITGDKEEVAKKVSTSLNLDYYYASLLPQDKLEIVKKEKSLKNKICYLGDGINDAPTLAISDVSISMGLKGSSLAIETSDIVLMDDKLSKVYEAKRIARRTMLISYINIILALSIKILCMILGALGIGGMLLAIFADVGVMIICVIFSMLNLYLK